MSNKTIKSVSFNKTNTDDARLLKAVRRRNFSGFVKKALHAYLDVLESSKNNAVQEVVENASEGVAEETFTEEVFIEAEKAPPSTQERLSQLKRGISGPKLF